MSGVFSKANKKSQGTFKSVIANKKSQGTFKSVIANKKSQGSFITWTIAYIIIFLILVIFGFSALALRGASAVRNAEIIQTQIKIVNPASGDLVLAESLFFILNRELGGKRIYDKLEGWYSLEVSEKSQVKVSLLDELNSTVRDASGDKCYLLYCETPEVRALVDKNAESAGNYGRISDEDSRAVREKLASEVIEISNIKDTSWLYFPSVGNIAGKRAEILGKSARVVLPGEDMVHVYFYMGDCEK